MESMQYRLDQSTRPSIWKYLTIILIPLAQLVFSGASIAASRVFVDNFEGGISSSWGKAYYRDMCPSVSKANDGGSPKFGSGMLSCNWNGVVAWNDPKSYETLLLQNWSYNKEILLRVWIRADADGDGKAATTDGPKIFRLGGNTDVDGVGSTIATVNFGGGYFMSVRGTTGQLLGSPYYGPAVGDGNWHKLEIYIKESATNGIFRFWIDRTSTESPNWEYTGAGVTQQGVGWDLFLLTSNWSGGSGNRDHDANNHIYWDAFEIYSDTGTGAIGSLSDATISVSEVADPNPPILE